MEKQLLGNRLNLEIGLLGDTEKQGSYTWRARGSWGPMNTNRGPMNTNKSRGVCEVSRALLLAMCEAATADLE
jgi:hypothetical protein